MHTFPFNCVHFYTEADTSVDTDTSIDPTWLFVMDSNNNFINAGTLISVWG